MGQSLTRASLGLAWRSLILSGETTFAEFRKRGNEQLYRLRADDRKLRLEVRQILLDDLPNNLYINVEIIVNDAISQANDSAPLDLDVLGSEILRQAVGSFADDFQIADDRVDGLIVFYESVVIQPGYVALDFLNRFPISSTRSGVALRDINQVLFDDLPITWLDRPARDDFRANAKGIFNSIRELNEAETDLGFDFHQNIHVAVFALILARIGTEKGESF